MTDSEYELRIFKLKEFCRVSGISWKHPKVQAIFMCLHFRWSPYMYFGHVKYEYKNGKVYRSNRDMINLWQDICICDYREIRAIMQS
jgi:hypothetical protein